MMGTATMQSDSLFIDANRPGHEPFRGRRIRSFDDENEDENEHEHEYEREREISLKTRLGTL
jgi:hypothetical protein